MELWSLKAAVTQILRLLCLFCVIPKPLSFLFWIHGVLPAWRLQVHGTIHSFSWGLGVWTHVSHLHSNSKPMLHSSSGVTRHWTSGWSGMWGKYSTPEGAMAPALPNPFSLYLLGPSFSTSVFNGDYCWTHLTYRKLDIAEFWGILNLSRVDTK